MTKRRRRKCLNCGQLFRPDPRNVRHQRYCSAPACRLRSPYVTGLLDRIHANPVGLNVNRRGIGRRSVR